MDAGRGACPRAGLLVIFTKPSSWRARVGRLLHGMQGNACPDKTLMACKASRHDALIWSPTLLHG